MSTENPPWDQRIARVLVRPLLRTPVTPNQVTLFSATVAVAGCVLLATGDRTLANWGAGLFVVARFLDHFDGELARQKKMTSLTGYYLDYATGGLSYGALFLALGIGFRDGMLGPWSIALGACGTTAAVAAVFVNLGIDRVAQPGGGQATGYPSFAGFELEDGIYLLAPVCWLGWLEAFFIAACVGAAIYVLWSASEYVRARRHADRP